MKLSFPVIVSLRSFQNYIYGSSPVQGKNSHFTYDIARQEILNHKEFLLSLILCKVCQLKLYNVGLHCVLLVSVKEGTPEKDDLERLAKEVVKEWKVLGRRLLENDEAALDAIHKDNEECGEKAYKMLLKWKQAKGASGATFQVLHDALCHDLVDRKDLAEKFCLVDHDY